MRDIIKTVGTIDEFDPILYSRLGIGVELQDYTEPNLTMRQMTIIMHKYKKLLRGFKGTKSMHGPFLDLMPASPDREIRRVSQQRYLNALYVARELDLDYIVFHSQINPLITDPKIVSLNNFQSKNMWERIVKKSEYDGTILVENLFETDPKMLKKYIEDIDMPNIKVNLDLGHAKLTEYSIEEWVEVLGEDIEYIHVHTNSGEADTHSIPSEKEIKDLFEILDKNKINPSLSLEYATDNLEEEIKKYRKQKNTGNKIGKEDKMEIGDLINSYGEQYSPYLGRLVNHLPMAQWALYRLTGDIKMVEEFTNYSVNRLEINRVKKNYKSVESIEECLGKRDSYEACLDLIKKEAKNRDIDEYIAEILNTYYLGISSGLFHTIIRLGMAVEGMRYDPKLEEEVYRALAYYITSYRETKMFKGEKDDYTYEDLEPIFNSKIVEKILESEDSLGKRLKALYASEEYLESGFIVNMDNDKKVEKLLICIIPLYIRSKNIVALHCITGLHALVILEDYFEDYSEVLDLASTAIMTHIIAVSIEHKKLEKDPVALSWDYIIAKLVSETDAHSIKLTYSGYCLDKKFDIEELKRAAIIRLDSR